MFLDYAKMNDKKKHTNYVIVSFYFYKNNGFKSY